MHSIFTKPANSSAWQINNQKHPQPIVLEKAGGEHAWGVLHIASKHLLAIFEQ